MSLDVYLMEDGISKTGIRVQEKGRIRALSVKEWDDAFPNLDLVHPDYEDDSCLYDANITHNLGRMAAEAGIYKELWRPEELGIQYAHELIAPLEQGLNKLKDDPEYYEMFNPDNGWGDYNGLVKFVEKYLAACKEYPYAKVVTSR